MMSWVGLLLSWHHNRWLWGITIFNPAGPLNSIREIYRYSASQELLYAKGSNELCKCVDFKTQSTEFKCWKLFKQKKTHLSGLVCGYCYHLPWQPGVVWFPMVLNIPFVLTSKIHAHVARQCPLKQHYPPCKCKRSAALLWPLLSTAQHSISRKCNISVHLHSTCFVMLLVHFPYLNST